MQPLARSWNKGDRDVDNTKDGIHQIFTGIHSRINHFRDQIYVQVVWNEDCKSENLFPILRPPGHDLLHHPRLAPGSPVTAGTSFFAR